MSATAITHTEDNLPAGFESNFAKAGEITMHYVEGGHGEVVVLLHGWPQTWRSWRKVMPLLAQNYHVIAVDLPGLGSSDVSDAGYSKRTLAKYVHMLVESLGHKRILLVGQDLGAPIAYAYARQFPQELQKVVMMDDPIPGLKGWEAVRGEWPRWHFAFHNVPHLPEALVEGREKIYLTTFYRNAYQKTAMNDEDIDRYVAAYARPESLHAGFEYYRAFEQDAADAKADTTSLPMPILALGGEHSPWKEHPYVQLQGLADALYGEVVPECGHFIQEEQPEWLVARLRNFFEDDSIR